MRRQTGFTMMSMLFVLVALAALGAGLASISMRAHMGSASELAAAKAYQAAYAGLEWASFQVLRNPAPPAAAPACFAASNILLADFTVSVTCVRTSAVDGATPLEFYRITATACNAPASGACPGGGTPQPSYVERQLSRTLVR